MNQNKKPQLTQTYSVTRHKPSSLIQALWPDVKEVLMTDGDYDETEEYCEVCGVHYDAEDPCPFH